MSIERPADNLKRKNANYPTILDGRFFKVLEVDGDKVKAKCLNCSEGAKPVSGQLHPTSKFTSHLKRNHPEELAEYNLYAKGLEVLQKASKQSKLNFTRTVVSSGLQVKVDRLIVNFVTQTMQPLQIVEQESFRALVEGLNDAVKVMSRPTLQTRINDEYLARTGGLRKQLSNVRNVCLTADIWSSRHRSFMGVTCHWLLFTGDTPTRHSTLLALQRFKGSHTYDKIAEMLQSIISSYGLDNKTVCVVTDNGSNFVKAFAEFGIQEEEDNNDEDIIEELYNDASSLHQQFPPVENERTPLPKHVRCASHTLNLVGKTEFTMKVPNDAHKSVLNRRVMRSAMAKSTALWNKASRSVKVSESIKELTGRLITKPGETRWNSTFDAVCRLLELKDFLEDICKIAGINEFTQTEIEFLEDFKLGVFPVAKMLDTLQAEKDFCYGYLVPTLLTGKWELEEIIAKYPSDRFCFSIATELRDRLLDRFSAIFSFDMELASDEILATVTIPMFKMNWMIPQEKREEVKAAFIKMAKTFVESSPDPNETTSEVQPSFSSKWSAIKLAGPITSSQCLSPEVECLKYLEDPDESFACLLKYPLVRRMFLYLNTGLPSSAACERIFSYAGMILRPKRASLSDENFEKICFLKLYKDLINCSLMRALKLLKINSKCSNLLYIIKYVI